MLGLHLNDYSNIYLSTIKSASSYKKFRNF